ncbi:MAG: thioesterase family protein [Desulfurococcaceae archaeon]
MNTFRLLGDVDVSGRDFDIPLNTVCVEEYTVKDEHAAKHVGTGDVAVLSTPSMIAFMEKTSMACVQQYLPPEYTTVGVLVNVKHLNPAPVGSTIRVESKLVAREGRRLVFEVKALLKETLIGEGIHERFIVHGKRFIERAKKIFEQSG